MIIKLQQQAETRTVTGRVLVLPTVHPHSRTKEQTPLSDVVTSSIGQHSQHQEPSLALVRSLTPQGLFQHRHLGERMVRP